MNPPAIPAAITDWFRSLRREPFDYQVAAWRAYLTGHSGLVHAPTGMGKTLSVWLGPVAEFLNEGIDRQPERPRVLWITPLRALATDTLESLREPIDSMGIPWTIEKRTGDTSSSVKSRQRQRMPTALVTTPESLSLLLSHADSREMFADLRAIIVDEWHELLGTKRGVQTELCLARLRRIAPRLRTWGLSATLGNLAEAMHVLTGNHPSSLIPLPSAESTFDLQPSTFDPLLITAPLPKKTEIETLIPAEIESLPWAGHLGLKLLPQVIERIDASNSTLLFINTRSQAELWYQALREARPDWGERLAIHHGSLDRDLRAQVEEGLRTGRLLCVVCTSSLDLGVDFSPVDQVIQIGSPKGIARLLQRAGRSGHRPGATSRVLCVPTHAFELVEYSAARQAALARQVEARPPLLKPLDLLAQHLVTMALAGGFAETDMLAEVRSTHAYRNLGDEEWRWTIDFVTRGGPALDAYPQYRRIAEVDGIYRPTTNDIVRNHRLSIGTITSDASVSIQFNRGATLGNIEESFIARLKPGDRFLFAGRTLELVRFRAQVATVRVATGSSSSVPKWMGGRMPLSTLLADAVRSRLLEASRDVYTDEEMRSVAHVLRLQAERSRIPAPDELLIENVRTREGHGCFVFPFAGRLVHEGLAALIAWRIGRRHPRTIGILCTDYGFAMTSPKPLAFPEEAWREFLSPDNLLEDLFECLNATELARRQFRDIARVAGLIVQDYPGSPRRTQKQLQISSGLLFDVFQQFDPDNLLLTQARREVLESQLEIARLRSALEKLSIQRIVLSDMERLSPLAFPLWAEFLRDRVSTEKFRDRVESMQAQAAGG